MRLSTLYIHTNKHVEGSDRDLMSLPEMHQNVAGLGIETLIIHFMDEPLPPYYPLNK